MTPRTKLALVGSVRPTDTRLTREIALKVRPESLATNPIDLIRLQREGEVLTRLDHPSIAPIHGVEQVGETRALVLELVEGPTLADRIADGPISVGKDRTPVTLTEGRRTRLIPPIVPQMKGSPAGHIFTGSGRPDVKASAQLIGLAAGTGVVAAYCAIGFRLVIGFFQNALLFGRVALDSASPLEHTRGAWLIVIPPIALLVVSYVVHTFAGETKGHGVPEVMEAVLVRGGRIRARVVAVKALVSAITIRSGGAVGR